MSTISFSEEGWQDYLYWQLTDKKVVQKINKLLKSIERDGVLQGEGKSEHLKHEQGQYSRRIDDANRLVYKFFDNQIMIVTCRGHYGD